MSTHENDPAQSAPDLPPHLQRADFKRYFQTLTEWIPIIDTRGLEIGPMDRPLASKPEHNIRYLDAFSYELLYQKCKHNPNRDLDRLVRPDYVTGDRSIAKTVDTRFDYVTAVHVVEHVPNLLGWLRDLGEVVEPDGSVFLVVPDRRFTFDRARPLTSLGQLIENDRQRLSQPSFRSAFDQRFYHRNVSAADVWQAINDQLEPDLSPSFTPQNAFEFAQETDHRYLDVHCNVFEPTWFEELINASQELGLQPFRCARIEPTTKPFLDFMALLEPAQPV